MSLAANLNAGIIKHDPNQKTTSYPSPTDDLHNAADDSLEAHRIEVPEDFDDALAMDDLESIDWQDADYE